MQTTAMSINRAMSTLKSQKTEIDSFLGQSNTFMALTSGTSGKETSVAGMDAVQAKSHIQGRWDYIQGLLQRQIRIKDAINKSNLETIVKINGREVTVAEAIVIKANLPFQQALLKNLRRSYTEVSNAFAKVRAATDQRIDAMVGNSISETTSDEAKAAVAKQIRETQEALVAPSYIDPLGLATRIQELETEINFVTNELDWVLSDSNTNTTINVEM